MGIQMKKIIHISENDKKTIDWSGGSTTEIFIYPPESSYLERNFLFRISSATVNEETSVFTSLPEYNRILLLLEGNLHLVHEEGKDGEIKVHHESRLMTMEQDTFDGAFLTKSFGKCVDFNLMMRKGLQGNITSETLKMGETRKLHENWVNFVYINAGEACVCHNKEKEYIMEGELVIFLPETDEIAAKEKHSKMELDLLATTENTNIILGIAYFS